MPPNRSSVRAVNWCFTLNNYTDDDINKIQNLSTVCQYIVFGKEVGDSGTPHLQGFIQFKERNRFSQAKSLINERAHVEHARHPAEAATYCKKDGDFVEVGELRSAGSRNDLAEFKEAASDGMLTLAEVREKYSEVYAKYPRFCIEYLNDKMPQVAVETFPLREWQQELNSKLNREPSNREIIFVVDQVGNKGKSWFAHYYRQTHNNVQVLLPGKKTDLTYALDCSSRVIFLDAPRSKQNDFILYDFLEEIKNGYLFSGKYESRFKTIGKCHVCVLLNEMPDMSKLSRDRYDIINLT